MLMFGPEKQCFFSVIMTKGACLAWQKRPFGRMCCLLCYRLSTRRLPRPFLGQPAVNAVGVSGSFQL